MAQPPTTIVTIPPGEGTNFPGGDEPLVHLNKRINSIVTYLGDVEERLQKHNADIAAIKAVLPRASGGVL